MQKIIMLGTGNGFMYNYYETCFIIDNNGKYFLVDTGGSNDIVNILSKLNIKLEDIHDIFISHTHTDHILGLFWLLKKYGVMHMKGKYDTLNVYCNDEVATAIKNIYKYLYSTNVVKSIDSLLNIITLSDKSKMNICGMEYTFYDLASNSNKLYGFETVFDNNKSLVFLGDEKLNENLYELVQDKDYVMHEAFCLDSESEIFRPVEKNHSTVKDVCKKLSNLNIKNLILYHTVDNHLYNRKQLYIEEAKKYYSGIVIVPEDLDTIKIR